MKPLKALLIGGAIALVVLFGACGGWCWHYMHSRSIRPIPTASALVITQSFGAPTAVRVTDPYAIAEITRQMNAQVGSGWHPVPGEHPLPQFSVRIEMPGGETYWDIGDTWFGAEGLYKEVSVRQRDDLQTALTKAPRTSVGATPATSP